MDIFKDFLTAISRLWDWLRKNKKWVFQGIGVAVPIALVGLVVTADRNSDPAVAEAIETLSRELERKAQALADAQQREQSLQTALHKAISALPEQTEIPDAQARIKEALALAADGNTALAEAIFSEVEARKVAEGKAARESAYKEAAAAARHRGALAFLHKGTLKNTVFANSGLE